MNLAQHTKATAYVAAIDAVAARGQLEHVQTLAGELLELLEAAWLGDRDVNPENVFDRAHREIDEIVKPPFQPAAAPTSSMAAPATKAGPMTGRERTRRYRANLRARAVACSGQLPLPVTSVTHRHAEAVTVVTGDVTRAASLASSLSPLGPSQGPYGDRERVSSSERDAVTVTTLTPPEELDAELAAIFAKELALRPGVEFHAPWLWSKFRRHGFTLRSRGHMEINWGNWCKNERPTKESAAALEAARVVATAPTPEVEKGEAAPGLCSAGVDLEEHSRRVEAERRERLAREAAELRAQHESRWKGQLRDPSAAFTPEAMEAARRAS